MIYYSENFLDPSCEVIAVDDGEETVQYAERNFDLSGRPYRQLKFPDKAMRASTFRIGRGRHELDGDVILPRELTVREACVISWSHPTTLPEKIHLVNPTNAMAYVNLLAYDDDRSPARSLTITGDVCRYCVTMERVKLDSLTIDVRRRNTENTGASIRLLQCHIGHLTVIADKLAELALYGDASRYDKLTLQHIDGNPSTPMAIYDLMFGTAMAESLLQRELKINSPALDVHFARIGAWQGLECTDIGEFGRIVLTEDEPLLIRPVNPKIWKPNHDYIPTR